MTTSDQYRMVKARCCRRAQYTGTLMIPITFEVYGYPESRDTQPICLPCLLR